MKRKQSTKAINTGAVAGDLYALAGLADGFTVNKGPDASSLFTAIDAVIARAVHNLQGEANKEAAAHFAKSAAALETLATFLDSLKGTSEEESNNPSRQFRAMVAAVVRSFTGEAGRWMERGEMAQGEGYGHVGYLDGYLVAGGEGMELIRPNSVEYARRGLSQEGRELVGQYVFDMAQAEKAKRK